jgi:hypothetical protein
MCKPLAIAIGTMLLTTVLYGQPTRMGSIWMEEIRQEIWKDEIKRFKIKSVTAIWEGKVKSIHFYNDDGNVSRVEHDSAGGDMRVTNVFLYDSARQLIEKRIITPKGHIDRVVTYSYNSLGQLIKKEQAASDKRNAVTWTYEYDRKGNKIRETQESMTLGYSVTEFSYIKGHLSVSVTSEDLYGKTKRISYKYNSRGQVTLRKMIHYSLNNYTNVLRYFYNKAGKLATLKEKDTGWGLTLTTYQYNEKGLLESELWKSSLEIKSYKTTYIEGY